MALEIGDILVIRADHTRLVYVGNGAAEVERFIPKINAQGKPNAAHDHWRRQPGAQPLTEQQIAFWLAKKAEG